MFYLKCIHKEGVILKSYNLSFKQKNMLCHRCLMNVVKTLSFVEGLEEMYIDLESKKIKIIYRDENISKDEIKDIVNKSILSGKVVKLHIQCNESMRRKLL